MDHTALIKVAERVGGHLLPDTDQWRYRMEIRSESSSRLYTVAQRKSDGSWACSCPGWKLSNRRTCKHLTAMVPLLTAPEDRRRLG